MSNEASGVDYAAAFASHAAVAKQAKLEYEKVFTEMIKQLSPAHLEPFGEILLEHDNRALKSCESIENLRTLLCDQLLAAHNIFWEEYNVEYGITSMAMLKEQYADCVKINWNMHKKTPMERICNVRVRLLKAQINNLHRQVEHQQQQLKESMAKNIAFRDTLAVIKLQRANILNAMAECRKNLTQNKEKMRKMSCVLLELSDNKDSDDANDSKELNENQNQANFVQLGQQGDDDLEKTSIACITIDDTE